MRRHKVFLLSLGFLLVFIGFAFAGSTFNPEAGSGNNTMIYLFLTGTSIAVGAYLNNTRASKNKQSSQMLSSIPPGVGGYTTGQAAAVLQSGERISGLEELNKNVFYIFVGNAEKVKNKESITLDNIFKYIPSSKKASGLYSPKSEFQIRWDLPHNKPNYPHINVEGVEGAEDLNHLPLDFYPDSKTALKAYSSTKGKEVLNKIIKENKITQKDVDALNLAIKELSPRSVGIEAVKTGLPVSIGFSIAYNGYEVYSGQKDIATATVDVAEDTAGSAAGLYVAGETFATCMESGGVLGLEAGALGCGIAGATAGILTDAGVRSGLEYVEHYMAPDVSKTLCFMEMNEKRTVSTDCDGNVLFPLGTNKTIILPIDTMMGMNQKRTVSPDIKIEESKDDGGLR